MSPPEDKTPETPDVDPIEASTEDAPAAEAGNAADAPAADAGSRPASAPDATSDDAVTEAEASSVSSAEPAEKPTRRRSRRSAAAETPAAEVEKPARTRGAQPAPTRRRSRRAEGEPAAVVRAQAKYVRSSARKARLVCDHIRGKSVEEARAILALTPRAIARDWSKLLESAVANAEHNHELVGEDLYVKAVHADEGPTIKRFRPRAMGRATQIRKRTSHLTILLTQKD